MTTTPFDAWWERVRQETRRRTVATTKNRFCADCLRPCTGERCAQHASAARIGKPRGVADPTKPREKAIPTRILYPLPIPSDDTSPLTIKEQGKALCTKELIENGNDVCFGKGANSVEAKILCHGCPIKARCLAIGIAGNEPVGVWGGATPGERQKIRRKMVLSHA